MKNSVSIWYGVIFSLSLTSCFQTKESNNVKSEAADKPIVVPQFDPIPASPVANDLKQKMDEKDQSKLACIQSICGTEYAFTPEHAKHPEILEKSLKIIDDKLGRIIELKMGQTIKNGLTTGNVLETMTPSRIQGTQFTPQQVGFLNAFKYLKNIKNYYSSLERDSKNKITFNQEKLKKNNPELNNLEIHAVSSLAAIFQAGEFQNVDSLTYKYTLDQLKKRYSASIITGPIAPTESELLKFAADRINEMSSKVFSQIFIKELLVNEIQIVVEKASGKKELSVKEKIDLLNKYGSYLLMNALVSDEKILETFGQLPFSGTQLVADINRTFQTSFSRIFNDKEKFKSTYASDLLGCKQDLARSFSETPTLEEIKKADKLILLLAEKANAVINQKSMQSNPLEIEFIMPGSQAEVLSDWEKKFAYQLEQSKLIQKAMENRSDTNGDGKLLTTLAALYGSDKEMFAGVRYDCKSEEPSFLSDAAVPSEKKFKASSVVVKNIDVALGVVAHEIGHIAQYYQADLFKNELSCLESNYGSKQYLGEDFADLFSSRVLQEYYGAEKKSSNKNMICTFKEFKTMKLDELSLVQQKNDEHSSGLYRLLAVSAASNNLTNQCTTYLTKHEPQTKVFDNYCKWNE
ncbi:MAG: hypothetical protein H7Z71_11980 [Moraxellaceae bacterium]|nr:hypothetical protein [Pseudobdellovibrionaceae bacterium]